MPGEINLAKQWLAKAMNDLLNADNNLAAREAKSAAEEILN